MQSLLKRPPFSEEHIVKEDITSYELYEIPKLSMDKPTSVDCFNHLFASEEFRNIQPVPGAFQKLQEWKSAGHTLIVVTGRSSQFQERTQERVHQHFPGIFEDFIFANHNTDHELPKSMLCKQAGIQMMVDDSLDFAQELVQNAIPCFLLDNPRNRKWSSERYPGVYKVKSRSEIDLSLLPN
jgi:phosphoglycolate phosphatase-like HAD superfamily hydrolase